MEKLDFGADVACSLNDAEFHERRILARQTLLPQVATSKRIQNGLMLTFIDSQSLRDELETFVELERQCCEFLEFTLSSDAAEPKARLQLRIEGQSEAAATIEMFARAVRSVV